MQIGNPKWMGRSRRSTFSAFLLAALCVLVITPLFQQGSFIDANLYKTVAANFNEDGTSFWNMKFTNTSMQFFCEQPPLYMFLLGLFYQLFGLHFLSDRLFTFLQLILFLVLVYSICRRLFAERGFFFFLLNLFFLLSIQVLCWTFAQQVIESLVLLWAALSLYLYFLYLEKPRYLLILGFSLSVLLLFLTKGFQSCFVLILPIAHAAASGFEKYKIRFALWSVFFSLASIACLIFFNQAATNWFDCYYKARLLLTMNDVGATTTNHFALLFEALLQNILLLLSFATMFWILKKKHNWHAADKNQNALAFALLLTALGGILPFMLSLVQRAFYPVPAYLFLVLYFTYAFQENWWTLMESVKRYTEHVWLRLTVYCILLASLIYFIQRSPTHKREQILEEDIEMISAYFSNGDTLQINPELWNNFNLHALMYMKKKVSLSTESSSKGYVITPANIFPANTLKRYQKIQIQSKEIDLYKIQD